jgi:hypothetical protein
MDVKCNFLFPENYSCIRWGQKRVCPAENLIFLIHWHTLLHNIISSFYGGRYGLLCSNDVIVRKHITIVWIYLINLYPPPLTIEVYSKQQYVIKYVSIFDKRWGVHDTTLCNKVCQYILKIDVFCWILLLKAHHT